MATTIDVDALASEIAIGVQKRAAEAAVLTGEWLADDGRELDELQKIVLFAATLGSLDGLEADIKAGLERHLGRRVEVARAG